MVGSYKVKFLFAESVQVNDETYHRIGVMQNVGSSADMRKLSVAKECVSDVLKLKECEDIVIDISDKLYQGNLTQKVVGVAKCQK